MKCLVKSCQNNQNTPRKYQNGISYHRLPKYGELKRQWLKSLGFNEQDKISKYSLVCSVHFEKSSFMPRANEKQKKYLRESAIPTLFIEESTDGVDIEEIKLENTCYNINQTAIPYHTEENMFGSSEHFDSNSVRPKRLSCNADLFNRENQSPSNGIRRAKLQFLRNSYNARDKNKSSLREKNSKRRKIINLGHLLDELQEKNLISSCQKDTFLNHSNPNSIILNRYKKISYRNLSRKYSEEIRKFALNLNFYSPKAYAYIQKQYGHYSPPSRTLDNWYKVVNGYPGFTIESFHTLELLVRSRKGTGELVIGNVCLGEMYVHPKYEYDFHTNKIWGSVEFEGSDPNDDTLATQVIVFMFVSCTARWKIPLGYFPISSLTSLQKKNMIESCLRLLNDVGVITIGVTFNELSNSFTITRELGCNVNFPDINLTFKLAGVRQQFLIFFDSCHMFKLVRDVLANKGPLVDSDGNKISWHYLEELCKIQSKDGFHLADKLRKAQVYFNNQKMKVDLAVQTLSNSVASALEFCDSFLKLPQFEGCSGTIKFIRVFNNCFDILNSNTFQDHGLQEPLSESNFNLVLNNVKSSIEYISELKFLSDGIKVIDSKSKMGFIGIIGCFSNIQVLHDTYLSRHRLEYISFYKLSQVHIELFFSIVRSRLGSNSNPTLKQFITSYRSILAHVELNDASLLGKCIPQTEVSILNVSNFNSDSLINSSINRLAMLEILSDDIPIDREISEVDEPSMYDEDFLGYPIILSEFSINVIEHIGGFIVRYLFRKLNCEDCCKLIQQCNSYTSLIKIKNKGIMLTPSSSVLKICKYSEAALKRELAIADYKNITSTSKLFKKISYNVLHNLISVNIFNDEDEYSHSQEHINLLAHSIIEKYYDIRLKYFCNQKSSKLINDVFSLQRYNNNSIG